MPISLFRMTRRYFLGECVRRQLGCDGARRRRCCTLRARARRVGGLVNLPHFAPEGEAAVIFLTLGRTVADRAL